MDRDNFEINKLKICSYDGNAYNYSIDASAGTGKTYTIEQIVMKCIDEGVSLRSILIVTYTEKATGELRDRIRQRIDKVLADNKLFDKPLENRQHFVNARAELEQTDICTIHSFCQKTLRLFAYDSGRTMAMNLVDDGDVGDLIDKMARDEWPKLEAFKTLLELSKDSSSKLVNDCKETIQNVLKSYYLRPNGEEDTGIVKLENILKFILPQSHHERILTLDDLVIYYTKSGEESLPIFPKFSEYFSILSGNIDKPYNKNRSIEEFIQSILDKKGIYNGSIFKGYKGNGKTGKNLEFDQTLSEACQYFDALKIWIQNNLNEQDKNLKQQFILQQIPVVYQAWRKYKADARLQSYSDMIASVYESIDGPLCEKLRKNYRIGIIDEFQDTNQMQWKIFEKLFLQSKENPDHQLIVVGDPKQSIYAFQNADVNVYMQATECFSMRSQLDTNYRSTNRIIEACNELFKRDDATPGFFNSALNLDTTTNTDIHFSESNCPAEDKKKRDATLDGKPIPAVWLSEKDISPKDFASEVTKLILQCCKRDAHGRSRLQVFDKETNELRNVSFRDFAILARSSSEMDPIKKALSKAGIPYLRYKEGNLFSSRECIAWLALCKAIHATDFSEKNRKLLTEVLITDFFNVDLLNAENERYDSPTCKERMDIADFQTLAKQKKWAAMLECIYQKTGVQDRLSDFTRLQELARLRQIGQYIVDRLYTQHCDLGDIIRHLQKLYQNGKATEDENANLVARNSDFDVVQVMTIHASKGLEFPVVIAVAGFKGFYYSKQNASYLYHNADNQKCLGISENAKKQNKIEQYLEWQRLFYVAYTRASSLLVLPRYAYEPTKNSNKEEFKFLKNTMANLEKLKSGNNLFAEYRENLLGEHWNEKIEVKDILHTELQKDASTPEDQKKQIQSLNSVIPSRGLYQHSYSSLANKSTRLDAARQNESVEIEYVNADDVELKGQDDADDIADDIVPSEPSFTDKGISVECAYSSADRAPKYEGYPCGTKLGTAVHEVFECIDFADSRKDTPDQCTEIRKQAQRSFIRAGLKFADNEVLEQTTSMVWNALHAALPVICGSEKGNGAFKLCELENDRHFPEVEFELNADDSGKLLKAYATGSIDLIFVRDGRYAIVDWKTNRMTPETLCDAESIRKNVDEHYAIQRVLYSYCLIKWLKSFPDFESKTEEEIFRDHFGGIYYVYVRGCLANTGNGVYAHTWKSFRELKASYDKIKQLISSKA
jgi:exodeoxyribonuclease V beta subunit